MSALVKTRHSISEGPSVTEVRAALKEMTPSLDELFSRYATRRAALLPVLRKMQERFGWLPPIVQREVAFALGITPADVFRVVQFYTLFRGEPCGKHVIMVCGTISCELAGCNSVIKTLCEKTGAPIGGTSPDGLFTIERVECLGWCHKAPVAQVNESPYHENLDAKSATELVERLRDEEVRSNR